MDNYLRELIQILDDMEDQGIDSCTIREEDISPSNQKSLKNLGYPMAYGIGADDKLIITIGPKRSIPMTTVQRHIPSTAVHEAIRKTRAVLAARVKQNEEQTDRTPEVEQEARRLEGAVEGVEFFISLLADEIQRFMAQVYEHSQLPTEPVKTPETPEAAHEQG